jgi:hypothetical protein
MNGRQWWTEILPTGNLVDWTGGQEVGVVVRCIHTCAR